MRIEGTIEVGESCTDSEILEMLNLRDAKIEIAGKEVWLTVKDVSGANHSRCLSDNIVARLKDKFVFTLKEVKWEESL